MFIGLRRSITVQVTPRCPRLQRTSPPPRALLGRRYYMSDSTPDPAALSAAIDTQGAKVRQLKADKAPKEDIDAAVSKLLALKANISGPSHASGSAPSKKAKSAAPATYTLKTPKGTKDWDPLSMRLRSHIFSTITRVFEAHGAVTIDTPVFELKEILSGKYGEDSKLIYDLQDQGGELCSLRYDLTVPFARFVAMNPSEYGTIKRYHIAKVYRRDQPAMSKGRFREFYQCDFDIAGLYDPMIPDSEILVITVEILQALQMPDFKIKLNHRKILDGIFSLCGVPEASIRPISSAVDKLDKSPWSAVRAEMVDEKGLAGDVADKIGEYVKLSGGRELLQRLEADEAFQANKTAVEGLKDMAILFDYLDNFGIAQHIVFDLSLARGLDYYTGIIYEAVTSLSAPPGFAAGAPDASAPSDGAAKKAKAKKDAEGEVPLDESTVGVGSIAAGGRYDHLVGMFSGSKKPDAVPCVGISIGVERVFAILMQRLKDRAARGEKGVRPKRTEVFVMSVGDGMVKERMGIAKMMWDAGIKAEFLYKARPKPQAQFAAVDRDGTPLAVLLAPEEWKDGSVRVKVQRGKDSEEGASKGEVVKVGDLVKHVKERLEEMLAAGEEGTGF